MGQSTAMLKPTSHEAPKPITPTCYALESKMPNYKLQMDALTILD